MEYTYTGIILNKRDIGETDRIYSIYTLEQGKISAIARGVRKAKAKLAGHLENFYLVDFTVMKNRGLGNISSSIVENNFFNLHQDLESLKEVFEVIKIFTHLINDEEKDDKVFALMLEYLESMDVVNKKHNDLNVFKIKKNLITQGFLFKLLDLAGYRVETNKCVKCHNKFSKSKNFFNYNLGGIICRNCLSNSDAMVPISDNAIKIIRIFFQNKLNSLFKLNITQKETNELNRISQNFIKWIL